MVMKKIPVIFETLKFLQFSTAKVTLLLHLLHDVKKSLKKKKKKSRLTK